MVSKPILNTFMGHLQLPHSRMEVLGLRECVGNPLNCDDHNLALVVVTYFEVA